MAATSQPTFRRERLGQALRRLREAQGMTQTQAAEKIGFTDDRISRAENGRTKVEIPLLRSLMDIYKVKDPELRSALEDMARNVSQRGWWHSYASVLHVAFQDFLGLERDARQVRTWQALLVPGLLQTEDYCRALLQAGAQIVHKTPARIESLTSVRMERKMVLDGDKPLRFDAVVSAAALVSSIGNPAAMRSQIKHLLAESERETVGLRVLPLECGPHVGSDGSFTLFEFPDASQLASLESLVSQIYLEDDDSLQAYSRAYLQVSNMALDQRATRDYLANLARSL